MVLENIVPMIIKGILKEFGSGFRKLNSTNTKFDYIIIGEHRIKKISVSSFLEPKLNKLLGSSIEVSVN